MAKVETLGEMVKRHRNNRRFTQEHLSILVCGETANRQYIAAVEADIASVSTKRAERLALLLGIVGKDRRAFMEARNRHANKLSLKRTRQKLKQLQEKV